MAEVIVPVALLEAVAAVDLAEDGDFVAGLAQQIGKERNVRRQRKVEVFVGQCAGGAGVLAGERRGARGSAERVGAEGILEAHALAADAVVIGGFENGIAGDGQGVGALALAEKEDEVGPFGRGLGLQHGRRERGSDGCAGNGERALQEFAAGGTG